MSLSIVKDLTETQTPVQPVLDNEYRILFARACGFTQGARYRVVYVTPDVVRLKGYGALHKRSELKFYTVE